MCFSLPAYGHPQQIADVCNHAEAANEMTMMESIDVRWISSRLTGVRGEKARLAEALCISPDQVAKMLAGVRRVQPKEIPKLLEFFGEDRLLVTPAERRLVELYRLAPEGRREAVEILLSVPPSPQKTP